MKIFILTCLFLVLLSPISSHSSHESDAHAHDHDHDHHDIHTNSKAVEPSKVSFEEKISGYLADITQNKVLMMTISVIIISIPSFPAFLILLLISKFSSNKQKGVILNEKYLRMMICLAIGSLTGDVFFGMMEHILKSSESDHDHDHGHDVKHGGHEHKFKPEVFCIIIGIFFFYVVDRSIGHSHDHSHGHGHGNEVEDTCEHSHDHNQSHNHDHKTPEKTGQAIKKDNDSGIRNRKESSQTKPKEVSPSKSETSPQKKAKIAVDRSVILYLVADFMHNVIDGIGIGVAFTISNSLGATTTLAVATHELPHEIGDFAILLKKNYSLGAILLTQLSTATGALFGGLLGIFFGNFAEGYLLGFTAGGFLYLALGNMLPELLHSPTKPTIPELIMEAGLGFLGAGLIVISA